MLYLQMPRNNYPSAGKHILDGDVKTLNDLWEYVDPTPFSRDAKTTPERLNRMLENMSLFRFGDIFNMSQTLGIDEKIILDIFYNDYIKQRRKKK